MPRVDGQLAVARAFGDKSLKKHLSSEPYVVEEDINADTEVLILASDGLWKVTMLPSFHYHFLSHHSSLQCPDKNKTTHLLLPVEESHH